MDRFTEYFLVWSIVGIAGTINGIMGFDRCFEKRHGNHIVYWVYFMGKGLVTSWYASALVYRPPSMTIEVIWVVVVSVLAVASFVVLWYTWDDDPLKIGLYGVASDAISGTSMMVGALIVNMAAGREISEQFLRISLQESVIVSAISVLLFSAAIKLLGRAIDLYRNYEIRQRKLMTFVVIAVIAGLSSSNLSTRMDLGHGLLAAYMMFIILLVMMGFLVIRRLGSQVRRKEMLRNRRQITEAYLLALETQSERIGEQEEVLDFIKKEIKDAEETAEQSRLKKYVEDLRNQAEDLRRGAYSGNIALDAVLSVFFERFKARGIDARYGLSGMQDAGEKSAEISMRILGWAEAVCAEDTKTIDYEISKRGNQCIFALDMPMEGKSRTLRSAHSIKKELRYLVSDTDPVSDTVKNGKRTVRVMTEDTECSFQQVS